MKKTQLKNQFVKTAKNDAEVNLSNLMVANQQGCFFGSIPFSKQEEIFYQLFEIKNFRIVLDVPGLIAAREVSHNFGKIDSENKTIEFGYFPDNRSKDVDDAAMQPTGKTFSDGSVIEYRDQDNGERYVKYLDPNHPEKFYANTWGKVRPLEWEIWNWEHMPSQINPQGDGRDSSMQLVLDHHSMNSLFFRRKMLSKIAMIEEKEIKARQAVENQIIKEVFTISPELLILDNVKKVKELTKVINNTQSKNLTNQNEMQR